MSIAEYQERRDRERQPEVVLFPSTKGRRIELAAVEEREADDAGRRVVRLVHDAPGHGAGGPGWKTGQRLYVSASGIVLQVFGACRECGVEPGKPHRASCPRAGRTVSHSDDGILRGWSA